MSTTQNAPDRVASPLASNNPFRNKVGSGSTSPINAPGPVRPASKNPFLDSAEVTSEPTQPLAVTDTITSPKDGTTAKATELLADLTLNGKAQSPTRGPKPAMNGDVRRENMPPRPHGRGPPPGYRPPLTEEERKRREAKMRARAEKGELDIFADPPDASRVRERRPPRRNSESSIRDKPALDPEDEKKRRERKYRESRRSGKTKPTRRLDVIDKLDVTSIYGTGLFHHDGPFDACNPNRNRKGSRQAPMQAFPEGSLNMQIGGSGPVNKRIDLKQYHGMGQEAHVDFNEAAVVDDDAAYIRRAAPQPDRNGAFSATTRVEPVHGSETAGLGTSTFLEGAPASRAAIARRESEYEAQQAAQSLSRKKSLAQRIRGARSNTLENRTVSPDGTATTPLDSAKSESNANPFFKDYDQEYEKKGQQIAFAEAQEKVEGRARAPSSPRRGLGLERTKTAESIGGGEEAKQESKASVFLNRVKSLKGGPRRTRPERRDTSG